MYRTAIILLFLLITQRGATQDNQISVTTHGEVQLPADIIRFNIEMNAEADSPQDAYNLHKKRERVLACLLNEHRIPEEDIHFQPMSIHSIQTNRFEGPDDRIVQYRTIQQVSLCMTNFDTYEQIQVALIEHGFDSFSGRFQSSQVEKGENDALRLAIREAREKAAIIAKEADETLGTIKRIRFDQQQGYPAVQIESDAVRYSGAPDLMEFKQTVTVRATVSIDFYIVKGE